MGQGESFVFGGYYCIKHGAIPYSMLWIVRPFATYNSSVFLSPLSTPGSFPTSSPTICYGGTEGAVVSMFLTYKVVLQFSGWNCKYCKCSDFSLTMARAVCVLAGDVQGSVTFSQEVSFQFVQRQSCQFISVSEEACWRSLFWNWLSLFLNSFFRKVNGHDFVFVNEKL